MLAGPLPQEFEEAGRGWNAAGVVVDRFAADDGEFGRRVARIARSKASTSFHGTITTSSAMLSGTPPEEGTTALSSPVGSARRKSQGSVRPWK